jgi:hypothetical protein
MAPAVLPATKPALDLDVFGCARCVGGQFSARPVDQI